MEHLMKGCEITPLSSYLKALGIFKVVAEQKDKLAKGKWKDGTFILETKLNDEDLIKFFSEEYCPSPIMSPWNGGSGFYPNDEETKDKLKKILNSNDSRFSEYKSAYNGIVQVLQSNFSSIFNETFTLERIRIYLKEHKPKDISKLNKIEEKIGKNGYNVGSITSQTIESLSAKYPSELKEEIKSLLKWRNGLLQNLRPKYKSDIVTKLRDNLGDKYIEWIDSTILVNSEGETVFPKLLGSGGNEGRLDYSSLFISSIINVLIENKDNNVRLLKNSLFGHITDKLTTSPIGKFDPGKAGGSNQGNEIETKDFKVNPWDIVLLVEGVLMWSNSIGRRNSISASKITSPFTVMYSPYGYGSANSKDTENSVELWTPIWSNYAFIDEIKVLFREGRAAIKGRIVKKGLDFVEAINSLGVDRGIEAFVRYCFLIRRGESYISLPSGYYRVKYNRYVSLIGDLDRIFSIFEQNLSLIKGKGDSLPKYYESLRRDIYEGTYDLLNEGSGKYAIKLLRTLGKVEMAISKIRGKYSNGKGKEIRPLYGLNPKWIEKTYDDSSEFRIALSLSLIESSGKIDPIRTNLEGTTNSDPSKFGDGSVKVSWTGLDLPEKMINTLLKRFYDLESEKEIKFPLKSMMGLSLGDVMKFINGNVDDKKIEELVYGFSLINHNSKSLNDALISKVDNGDLTSSQSYLIDRTWGLVRLYLSPELFLKDEKKAIKVNKNIVVLLLSGKAKEAYRMASVQLMKLNMIAHQVDIRQQLAKRYIAALLIPLKEKDIYNIKSMVIREEVNKIE